MKIRKLLKIANSLNNEELCTLFNMTSGRFNVFIGLIGNCVIDSKPSVAILNGAHIQINLELSELNDIRESDFIHEAMLSADQLKGNE